MNVGAEESLMKGFKTFVILAHRYLGIALSLLIVMFSF
jgi:hypothetical protein